MWEGSELVQYPVIECEDECEEEEVRGQGKGGQSEEKESRGQSEELFDDGSSGSELKEIGSPESFAHCQPAHVGGYASFL